MPKTNHIAVTGAQTFTRSSATKVYSHCVALLPSIEHAKRVAVTVEQRTSDIRNFAYYQRCILGTSGNTYGTPEQQAAQGREQAAQAEKALAGAETAPQFADAQQAKRLAAIDRKEAEGFYKLWQDGGWSSRQELARKVAQAAQANPYWANVCVLEAQVVAPKAKKVGQLKLGANSIASVFGS